MFPLYTPKKIQGYKRTKDINKNRGSSRILRSRKGCTNITGMRHCVSASSITLGPSLGEKVDAADRDHTSDKAFG
jgi:hypothetical protein